MNTPHHDSKGEAWVAVQMVLLALILLAGLLWRGGWDDTLTTLGTLAGLIAGAVGGLLLLLSASSLGTSLSIFPRPKRDGSLTQNGVYSIVRHPMYAGVILAALAWSLLLHSLAAVILTGALALFFDRKARREEQWLEQQYPDYPAYRRRVRRLIPWIY